MTPKEKAIELYDKFIDSYDLYGKRISEECALIAVDEIIKEYEEKIIYKAYDTDFELWKDSQNYWKEVKQEIEKL